MASILQDAAPPITVSQAADVLARHYGITGTVAPLVGDRDRNFLVTAGNERWMLKIANPAERLDVLEMQQQVLLHLRHWDPGLPVAEPVPTVADSLVTTTSLIGADLPVRLTTFLPGVTVEDVGWNRQLRSDAAAVLARIDLALRSFDAPVAGAPDEWRITRLEALGRHTHHLTAEQRELAERWLSLYSRQIAGRLAALRTQPIHGDFNPANLIVDPEYQEHVTGVIDFGDMSIGPLVADPAISAAYQCLGAEDPGAIIAGAAADFSHTLPLTAAEVEMFPLLAISRLVQSMTISAWRAALHPDNREYILIHANPIWETLQRLDTGSPDKLVERVTAACGTGERKERPTNDILEIRSKRFGPGMRLSYDRPLRFREGSGVWLTDSDGDRYLDAYNNVAHVGHSNPEVVAALAAQASRLNTNTRYLVDEVVDYAERLTSLLPDPLDVVFFANSGSEANDLAWRMARTVTGHDGMVVTRHAYHGATHLTISSSPEEIGIGNVPSWVATAPAPVGSDATPDHVEAAMDRLDERGAGTAAFACDTVFSSDGIYEPPFGYLAAVYERVRQRGGLAIADEIQAGFGRVGPRLWGFATDSAVPDIVTLGKPMGNGHPMAAVITTTAIAAEFSAKGYYFSTFAGNPVSAAVGGAVLNIMESEDLPAQAACVGDYIRSGLDHLVATYGLNAEVRGPGLFIGLELMNADGVIDPAAALSIQNRMREQRVLIGRTGAGGNVLKIRPPLVFAERHADILLETLNEVLASG